MSKCVTCCTYNNNTEDLELSMKICVTGGCGFIGSHYIKNHLKNEPDDEIVNLDCLTYCGNLANVDSVKDNKNYVFCKIDITDTKAVIENFKNQKYDCVVNFAAESHVDRSILDPGLFLRTNAFGTLNLLNAAKEFGVQRFLQVSTDEVYGTLPPEGAFSEDTPVSPRSPYSASKAAADHLVMAYHETFGLDTVITRCSNNFGPFQFPEKMLPLMIINSLRDKKLPVYGDGKQKREWLFVGDHCDAIDLALKYGKAGDVYNVGGENERENIEVITKILTILGKPRTLIEHVSDRPGHDRRYSINSQKIRTELGWKPKTNFDEEIEKTVKWYIQNETWWSEIISGEYRNYYDKQYTFRK